jgi:MYXO-CTERM domain-containing protein
MDPGADGDDGSVEGSGCSCRAAGGETSGGGAAGLAALVGLGLVITRRRRVR